MWKWKMIRKIFKTTKKCSEELVEIKMYLAGISTQLQLINLSLPPIEIPHSDGKKGTESE